jgi:ABC-2 type transport system ATP-binding protein
MSVIVKNLTKVYGTQKAVNNISFELKKGTITGFIGPNGSGKSTTMKAICGILTPDTGEILIEGKNILDATTEIKKEIGYLPENNPLYYDQYVQEYLGFVGRLYKIKNLNTRLKEIIGLTGLTPEKTKKIGQLSKGYKQRVGLAQALIHNPRILILDEPTTGLDPNQLVEIRELIKNISHDKTVVLSTHILQEVEAICQRVLMINKGIIVANQETQAVKNNVVENKQTILVEFKELVPEELIKTIPGLSGYKKQSEKVWFIEGDTENDLRENIFQFAMLNKLNILELQSRKRTLEDTFRELSNQ